MIARTFTCHAAGILARATELKTETGSRIIIRLLLLTPLLIALVGCGLEAKSDLKSYVLQVKARQKPKIPPLPEPEEFEIFTYDKASLDDPFIPSQVIVAAEQRTGNGLQPNLERERDLLEQFKLGSLRMMGSLERNGQRWALVRTAEGSLHRTSKGHYMGENNGEIIAISETQIELREIVADGLGSWVEKFTTLSTAQE